ncbi:type II secretion system minor pseudopilin GspI [Gilvimarinus agarilyticus]|uniref:type II secretion system minor pseudopilin GspI n=1 Tax=unclassified Gilvimarinus TaxID=2642066 RepID=UPI001C0A4E0F|nr:MULTISPECIES: type II secretion system minor pseudopilin GspI [unclassified Gilvimarinus]MBU2886245.1 type II secretion system minor pseudopilin GspI [Gilvimarinus agarilyticus]MDO6570933.1 type II secretion system minor pseudopilin GspI [Gilvimarinus sp. 2_MG-2023]MDO6747780.1 type II secretion system minor pseudopilin GspI [Gilvimarinus sp. 1_MG-2023]
MKKIGGFTLIEVMVALAIVGTALPALMMLITSQLQGAGITRDKTQAYWVAENQLTRITMRDRLLEQYTIPDSESGTVERDGVRWYWELNSQDTEVEGFKRLDMRVSLEAEKDDNLATLTGFINE